VRDEVLSEIVVSERVGECANWTIVDGSLHRELTFPDFAAAFAFMVRVALAAERLDHHPDWSNSWNRVVIDITNHASGGLTDRCFQLAAAVDAAAGAA
jgi:4a-hydroxytetrahydrobiopterin dehydratase